MIKRLLIMLLAVGVIFGGIFGFIGFKNKMIKQYMANMGNAKQTVSTMIAKNEMWSPSTETIASLSAVHGVDLSAEVSGMVENIFFQQGDDVAAGTPLLQLRADSDNAKLKSLQAELALAQQTAQRNQAQFAAKAVSQQTVDNDKTNVAKLTANIAEQQALINKKLIRAPFAGRIGIRQVDVGQFLNAGTAIASLQALDKLYIDFFIPQRMLSKISIGQAVSIKVDAFPEQNFVGKIAVINPKVDEKTRNVQIRALLDNAKHQLLAGMYATATISTDEPQQAITLPNAAISFNSYGATVFLIETDKDQKLTAKQVFVMTGATRGDQVAVVKGIKEGDTVVTSGQLKLRNGSLVTVNNTVQPNNNPAPLIVDR